MVIFLYYNDNNRTQQTASGQQGRKGNKMSTPIIRTTEDDIRKITREFTFDNTNGIFFIYIDMLTDEEQMDLLNLFIEHDCEQIDSNIFYGFDDEYIILDK